MDKTNKKVIIESIIKTIRDIGGVKNGKRF